MPTVYVVTQDTNGAHEPEGFLSVWSTEPLARAEIARLGTLECAGTYHVATIGLDVSSDDTQDGV